jgi:hypothetical protein
MIMMIKKILKLIFLSILFFSLPILSVQAKVPIAAKVDIREFKYMLDAPPNLEIGAPAKLIYIDLNLDNQEFGNYISKLTNTNQDLVYSPLFTIAGIPPMEFSVNSKDYEPLYTKARNLVFPLINGAIFYKMNILKLIDEQITPTLNEYLIDLAENTIKLANTFDWANNGGQFLDTYYVVPGNYQHYLNMKKELTTINGYEDKKSVLFFAGLSSSSPNSDPYFDHVTKKIKQDLYGDKKSSDFFYPVTIERIKKEHYPLAFGACYVIHPAGSKNECLNTSREECLKKAQTPLPSIKTETHFAYGISCQKLDFLFKNEQTQTQQASYNMLIYFHGLFTGKEPTRLSVQMGFYEKVFKKMAEIQKNFITVWMDQPKTNFLTKEQGGESWAYGIPFADIVKKSYDQCANPKTSSFADIATNPLIGFGFNPITIKDNLTANVYCGYTTKDLKIEDLNVAVAGHSAGGQPASLSIGNPSVHYTIILDGLYYSPTTAAKDCSKWWAIQTNKDIPDDKNGQKAIASWRALCPNNIVKGTSSDHYQVPADLPPFLMKATDTNAGSNPVTTTIPDTPLPDRAKIIFKPQVAFGGITTGTNLADYINSVYKYLLGFALFVTGFVIVLGGLKYMIGKADGLAMVKNAFIGLTLLAGTHLIMKTVNPNSIQLQIIEVAEIGGVSIKGTGTTTSAGGTVSGTSSLTPGTDLSPEPAIQVGSGWYFPVALEDLNKNTFTSRLKSKSDGGTFGYLRPIRPTKDTPIHCHGGVDINTLYESKPGKVYAIADGVVIDSSNHFTACTSGTPDKKNRSAGWITIEHKDANGNVFHARYAEMNVNCKNAPGESTVTMWGKTITVKNSWDCTPYSAKTEDYLKGPDTPILNLKIKYPPGTQITAGQFLGNATYCGMVHFELLKNGKQSPPKKNEIGGSNAYGFWDMKADIWPTMVTELGYSPEIIAKYPTIDAIALVGDTGDDLRKKNCLDSAIALENLGAGKNLLNPVPFLTELWNKTGALGKQKSD